jgi:HlyD family secretion protein
MLPPSSRRVPFPLAMIANRLPYKRGLLLLLVLGALAIPARALFLGKAVTTLAPKRQALLETVITSGRVITPTRVELGSELLGHVIEVTVEEGDHVRAGQVLARLRDDEQRAAHEQARRGVEEAQARLAQLREVARPVAEQGLLQAQANLAQAQAEFERVKTLADAGFYNQSRLDESRRALDGARAAHEAAQAQARGNRPEGVENRLAEARLAQLRAALDVAEAKRANTVIRAPAAAVVVKKRVERGDIVTQGKRLFDLATDGETQIILQIDEKNLGRLRVGQAASVLADAYPGQPFAAEIFTIAPAVDAEKGSVEVKLRVKAPPAFVKPDMTVSVEITVGERPTALSLAAAAVRDATSAQPWVLLIEAGRAVRRPVTLGLRGSSVVEVSSGLKGDEAVIPLEAAVVVGDKVRSAK